jgi:hypothetical protein
VCDVAEVCDGSSSTCPPDGFASNLTQCRAAAGACDVAELCTGNSANCPADVLTPSGTVCRSSAGVCDPAEVCTGSSPQCPANQFAPNTTVCRSSAGVCDLPELCPGNGPNCPANMFQPAGTSCDEDQDVCTIDQCDGAGNCEFVQDGSGPSCGICGQFATGTCSVSISKKKSGAPAGPFTSLQAAVNAADNGAVIHVSGVCKGPTLISSRMNLTIEGDAPALCPPGPRDLTSTLVGDVKKKN